MLVITEKKGAVTTIIINRPEVKNAVNGETAAALAKAFRDFESDDTSHVAVLCGTGGTFCAGADLKAIATAVENSIPMRLEEEGDGPMGPSRMLLSKPVIAAIDGYAVAGGMELALWCDLRVMEEGAVMGIFCRRWGVPLIDGGTVRLPRLIGLSRALDLILTGREVDAEECLQMGLANRMVPEGTARQAAEQLAAQMAALPQTCLRNDRLSAYEQFDLPFEQAMLNEFRRGMKTIQSGESVMGAGKFVKSKAGKKGDK